MRKFTLALILLSVSFLLKAQAYEDKIEYNKTKQDCIVMEYGFSVQAVENALVSKMSQLGYKPKEEKGIFNKDKGFKVYNGALIAAISAGRYDYITYVERKSKKQDGQSILYFIVMKDNMSALSRLNTQELNGAKTFLSDLLPDIEAADLELQITVQEDMVGKAEKKLKNLQTDRDDMEKKIKKLQDDLEQNKKDQEKQNAEIGNQRKALDALKGKRKTSA